MVVLRLGYLSPLKTIGKFISFVNESVSTMPGNIENRSSVLFKGGRKSVEYPGGVFITQGLSIL